MEVHIKFRKSSGYGVRIQNLNPDSGPDLPRRMSALSRCSCYDCRRLTHLEELDEFIRRQIAEERRNTDAERMCDGLWPQSSDRDVDAAVAVLRRLRHDGCEARCFHDVVWNVTGQYEASVRPVMVLAHLVDRERSSTRSEGAGQLHISPSLADDGHHPDERAVVPIVEVVRPLVPERRQQVDAGELDEVVAAVSL